MKLSDRKKLEEANLYGGIKFDNNKLRWSLVPWPALEEAVKVLTSGAAKYADFNWQQVGRQRFIDALQRHHVALMKGETIDTESTIHHAAHIICNALFILWHDGVR